MKHYKQQDRATKYDELRSNWRELKAQFKNLIRQVVKAAKS